MKISRLDVRNGDRLGEHVFRRRDGELMSIFTDSEGMVAAIWLGDHTQSGDVKYLDPAWVVDLQDETKRAFLVPTGQKAPAPPAPPAPVKEETAA